MLSVIFDFELRVLLICIVFKPQVFSIGSDGGNWSANGSCKLLYTKGLLAAGVPRRCVSTHCVEESVAVQLTPFVAVLLSGFWWVSVGVKSPD